ncbi:MAG: hypothetical protein CMA34_07145 [Euryarchaeota archaeon]|nr:hypothetical protein [Euryarchaeota archaeon]
MQLFGTDGIRGKVEITNISNEDALSYYLEKRILTPTLMRLIGEAVAIELINRHENLNPKVVIGWDNRPDNIHLTKALTQGLAIQGCDVHWAGEIATPGLHYCVLKSGYEGGLMVTASHNPAHDSGLKVFDELGFKTYPERENEISNIVMNLVSEDRELDEEYLDKLSKPSTVFDGSIKYQNGLKNRLESIQEMWDIKLEDAIGLEVIPSNGLLLDSSKGANVDWLSSWFSSNGLTSIEQSSECLQINLNCGAGNFSPTDKWSWDDLESEHVLLNSIKQNLQNIDRSKSGQIIAAALDGDADRCLLFEILEDGTGIGIVDGDRIADDILQAGILREPQKDWTLAASIESDLSLTSSLKRLSENIEDLETAVGDRWLSLALCKQAIPAFIQSNEFPGLIGCEDSGHIVLPILSSQNKWGLVGDGAMTLISTILARSVLKSLDVNNKFTSGWKLRKSVKEVDRKLWDGNNELSVQIHDLAEEWFTNYSNCTKLSNVNINGSKSLLLLQGTVEKLPFSLGIRNSGTEAKISVSLRLSPGCKELISKDPSELVEILCKHLSRNM